MEKLLKRIFVIAIAMLVLCTLAAVAGGGKESSEATTSEETTIKETVTKSTTITWSYSQEPPNWNYQQTGLTACTAPLLLNVWETLTAMEADGSSIGLLAESWEVSPDGRTVTFNLRKGVKFHDGSDFTSTDAVYSMNSNAQAGVDMVKTPYKNVKSVKAINDYTVQVTLAQPDIRFIPNMSGTAGIMVPEGFFENNDAGKTVVGTGPYVFTEHRIDQDLTMTRFEDYWGKKPYFQKAVQRFIPDETAAFNAVLSGEIDFISTINKGMDRMFTIAENNENINLMLIPDIQVSYWALNTNEEAFQDIRVRQAIQYGHNRKSHIDAATAGTATPSASMAVPQGVSWDSDYTPYPYNPAKAVELLKEAGYGPEELELDFPFANVAWHTIMAQVFQAEMAEIGIKINLRSLDLATWLDQVNIQGQYDVFQITSNAPLTHYGCGRGRQPFGKDNTAFCDEGMDKLIAKVEAQTDWDKYVEAQRELHDYVADQGWIFATKKPNTPVLYRSDLVGIREYRLPALNFYAGDLRWAD